MLFQRVNESSPERLFVIVKNSYSTASLSADQWCAWDDLTDEDGVAVTKPKGVLRGSIAGVVTETIAAGDFGVVQCWGYRATARVSGGSGLASSKVSEGTFLYNKTSGFVAHGLHTMTSAVTIPTWALDKIGVAMSPANTAAKATSATTWIGKVFVKCL
tara:strand:+ start:860 stop:1336 length:477 start_codon:yes stop_codon:yes gene_type:complete